MIVKDPQKEYKALFAELGISQVTKVIGVSKLKAKYQSYADKRALLESYDVFLADDRILPMMGRLLGKAFFSM